MKKSLLFLLALLICGFSIAQTPGMSKAIKESKFKVAPNFGLNDGGTEFTPSWAEPGINPIPDVMNAWVLPSTGGTSGNSRIPRNATARYQREEYLITAAEMAASGYPNGITVDAIGFLIATAGVGTQTGTLNIYLKNTTDATYTLGTTWTTTGFTQVSADPNFTVPIALGAYSIPFVNGTSFTYTGAAIYVAWEFANPSGSQGTISLVAYCNTNQASMCYGYQSATVQGTTLGVTAFRPATQFANNSLTDIYQVTNIYAQEKCPVPYGVPTNPSARVVNVSASPQTFDVTMTITDQTTSTVRYTDTQTVTALAGGSATVVNFTPWTAAIQENDNITVTVPAAAGETWTINNTMVIPVNINNNLYGYCYALNPSTGYGFTYNVAPGAIFASKFHMNGAGTIPGANLFIYNYAANAGNMIYAVVLNSAGVIVAQSANLVIAAGDLGTNKNFTFPTPPGFSNEDFYVGLAQPSGGTVQWYPMGCMNEAPYRANTFYTFDITGGTPSLFGADFKYMIEAQVAPAALLADDAGTVSIDFAQVITLGSTTPKATVKNYGANTETFDVTMTIGTYTSTKSVTSLASGTSIQVSFDPWANSLGDYTVNVCTSLSGDLDPTNDCKTKAIKVLELNKVVYGYNAFPGTGSDPEGPMTFNLSDPGNLTSLADQSTLTFIAGATWANGTWYGTEYSTVTPYNFITIDPVTGARTVVGDMGVNMNGLSFDPANGLMYGVSYSGTTTTLNTIDLITGVATAVGTAPGVLLINLAINNAGQCYSMDLLTSMFGSVDLTTGAFTVIGSVGFSAAYAQDMEFDRDADVLFMAGYGTQGELRYVDVATGSTMVVGAFEGGAEVTGFAIPYNGNKTLNLKVYLEGLYDTGTGLMKQAMNITATPEFGPGIADQVTVELHDALTPYGIAYSYSNVNLNTDGTLSITTIPGIVTGSYYVVIKHRNSIETWSSTPVSFAGAGPVSYDFTTAASQAYGNNMRLMGTAYVFYGGDASQDGSVDGTDMALIDNASTAVLVGYNPEDVNGDGIVDGSDMALIDNNATAIVQVQRP